MSFPTQTPRTFNRANIGGIRPNQMGCYGLFLEGSLIGSDRKWIYVGKGDIRARLLDHLNGDNPCINRHHPTHWVDVVTDDLDALEKALILEYDPICNRRVG